MKTDSGEPSDKTLLGHWKSGGQDAATEFHRRYIEKLLLLIQKNLAQRFSSRVDAEDLADSVLRTFFGAVADGRQAISPSDDVWKLLQTIALNKVRNQVKFHDAQKRSVRRTVTDPKWVEQLGEPTEQDAVDISDLIEGLVRSLDKPVAKTMEMLLAGSSVDEISETLKVSTRSVRRYREQIASQLQAALNE
jgi:DNA-directed RNA polymerase specialized sigma24 family protein